MTADELSTSERLALAGRENEQLRAEVGRRRTEADRERARAGKELAEVQASFEDTHADLIAARADLRADLQKVERERDGVRESLAEQAGRVEDLEATLAMRTRQLRAAQHDRDHIAQECDQARAWLRALLQRTHTEPSVQEKSMAVYISIGNSDDKLTQNEWSSFYAATDLVIRRGAHQVHGAWVSHATDPWQNACWCIETMLDPASVEHLKMRLAETAATFRQDSIAWAEAPKTEFLGSADA